MGGPWGSSVGGTNVTCFNDHVPTLVWVLELCDVNRD